MDQIKPVTVGRAMEIMRDLYDRAQSKEELDSKITLFVFFSPLDPLGDKFYWLPLPFNNRFQFRLILSCLQYITTSLGDYEWLRDFEVDVGGNNKHFLFSYYSSLSKYIRREKFGALFVRIKGREFSVTPLPGDCPVESAFCNLPSGWILQVDGVVRGMKWGMEDFYEDLWILKNKPL